MNAETALLVVTILCIIANMLATIADLVKVEFVLANARDLDLSPTFVVFSAVPKGAAAVGLVLGLGGVELLGLAAAIGLAAFFVCAVGLHIYKGAFQKIAAPIVFEVLALGALAYFGWAVPST